MFTTPAPTPSAVRGVRRLISATAAHDGVGPLDEAALLALDAAARPDGAAGADALHVILLDPAADGGEAAAADPAAEGEAPVIGYASILPDGTVQGAVDPAHRRRGHGGALLETVLAARPDVGVWAHGALPGSLALLESAGLRPVRTLLTLGRPLGDLPVPEASSSLAPLEITGFEAERDADDWVALNAEAFASHPEQGRMTRADLDERIAQPWFRADGFLLARHRGELVGYVWTKLEEPAEGSAERDGEIYVVGTAPAAQGHGVARLLLARALEHLAGAGARRAVLYVEGDNAPALSLYRRLGFATIGRDVQLRSGLEG